jgi:probable phosphoglycerate mutase
MLLYIIRHGDPDYETDSLTPKGRKQALALAKRLAVNGLDKIYSSPLGRARQTAKATCELLNLAMETEDWTSENRAYMDLSVIHEDGRRGWIFQQQRTNILNDDTILLGQNWDLADCYQGYTNDFKGGVQKIRDASDEFLSRHGYTRDGGIYRITDPNDDRVAVFCHQGFGITWLSHLLNIPPHIFWSGFDLTHSGVTIVHFENYANGVTVPTCLVLSDTSHIYKEDLPLEYNNWIKI